MKGDFGMAQFANTIGDEQETIINIDYGASVVHVYTSQRTVYQRLVKKIGEPIKIGYLKNKIVSGSWVIPFAQKKSISQILSRPTLIGGKQ